MYKFLALSFISIGLVACNKTSEDSALTINNQEYMPKHQLTANKYIYEYNNRPLAKVVIASSSDLPVQRLS
ncbi:hypothetical protein ACLBV8_16680 [Acinetobacter baumannii]